MLMNYLDKTTEQLIDNPRYYEYQALFADEIIKENDALNEARILMKEKGIGELLIVWLSIGLNWQEKVKILRICKDFEDYKNLIKYHPDYIKAERLFNCIPNG